MEFTGQAFEEMQEQNLRLMQQLREKDDSNLKLMSEVSTGYIFMYRVSQYIFPRLLNYEMKILIAPGKICKMKMHTYIVKSIRNADNTSGTSSMTV